MWACLTSDVTRTFLSVKGGRSTSSFLQYAQTYALIDDRNGGLLAVKLMKNLVNNIDA